MENQLSRYGAISKVLEGLSPQAKAFFLAPASAAWLGDFMNVFPSDDAGEPRVFTSLDAAINACVSGRGDVIIALEGYTETIGSATAVLADKAGVRVVGLGRGTARPTFTFSTATTATIPVSVANFAFENCIFTANFADIVAPFTLTTAANLRLKDCYFKATAANMNFLYIVDTSTSDNAADGLEVVGCKWIEPDLATVSFLKADADLDRFVFQGNYLNLGVNTSDLPAIATVATGKDLTNLEVVDNVIIRLNDANPLLITTDTTTANTGVIARNYVRHLDTAGELLVTAATNIGFFDNKATAVVDASGFLLPAADS